MAVSDKFRRDFITALDGFHDAENFKLRDDQPGYYEGLIETLESGKEAGTYALPTGTGKTALFSHISRAVMDMPEQENGKKPRVLIVVPTEQLLMQTTNEFHKFFPELFGELSQARGAGSKRGKAVKELPDTAPAIESEETSTGASGTSIIPAAPDERAQEQAYHSLNLNKRQHCRVGTIFGGNPQKKGSDRDIIITTYASLIAKSNKDLFTPENFQVLVLDEAHMGLEGNKPAKIMEFKDKAVRLGFTATETRGAHLKAQDLTDDHLIRRVSVKEAHERGMICDFNVWHVDTNLDMEIASKAIREHGSGGERHLATEFLSQQWTADARNMKAVKLYLNWDDPDTHERIFGKTGIVTCINKDQALSIEVLANLLVYGDAYIPYMHKHGRVPKLSDPDIADERGTIEHNNTGLKEYREWLEREAEIRAKEFDGKATLAADQGKLDIAAKHREMARRFRDEGIEVCRKISSDTPDREREQMINDHRAGKILLLAGIQIPKQGLDNSRAEILIRAEPSYSTWQVKQAGGRVLRKSSQDPLDVAYTGLGEAKFARIFELRDRVRIDGRRIDDADPISYVDTLDPDFVMPNAGKNAGKRKQVEGERGEQTEVPPQKFNPKQGNAPHPDDDWSTGIRPQKLLEMSRERRERLGSALPKGMEHCLNDSAIAQMLGFPSNRPLVLETINTLLEKYKAEKRDVSVQMPLGGGTVTVNTDEGVKGPHLVRSVRSYYLEPKMFAGLATELGEALDRVVTATRIAKPLPSAKSRWIPLAEIPLYAEQMGLQLPSIASLNQVALRLERSGSTLARVQRTADSPAVMRRGEDLVLPAQFVKPYNCRFINPDALYSIINEAVHLDRDAQPDKPMHVVKPKGEYWSAAEIATALNVGEDKHSLIEAALKAFYENSGERERKPLPDLVTQLVSDPEVLATLNGSQNNVNLGGTGTVEKIGMHQHCYYGPRNGAPKQDLVAADWVSFGDGRTGTGYKAKEELLPFIARVLQVPPPAFNGAEEFRTSHDIAGEEALRNIPDAAERVRRYLATFCGKGNQGGWRGPFIEQGPDGRHVDYRVSPDLAQSVATRIRAEAGQGNGAAVVGGVINGSGAARIAVGEDSDDDIAVTPQRVGMLTAQQLLHDRMHMRAKYAARDDRPAVKEQIREWERQINAGLAHMLSGGDTRIISEPVSHSENRYYFPMAMADEVARAGGLNPPVPPQFGGAESYFTPRWVRKEVLKLGDSEQDSQVFAEALARLRNQCNTGALQAHMLLTDRAARLHNASEAEPLIHKGALRTLETIAAELQRNQQGISEYQQRQQPLSKVTGYIDNYLRGDDKNTVFRFLQKLSETPDQMLTVAEPIDITSYEATKYGALRRASMNAHQAKVSELVTLGSDFDSTKVHPVLLPYLCLAMNKDAQAIRNLGFDGKRFFPPVEDDHKDWARISSSDYSVKMGNATVSGLKAADVRRVLAKWLGDNERIEIPSSNGSGARTVPVAELVCIQPERSYQGQKDPDGKLMPYFAPELVERIKQEVATGAGTGWAASVR